MFDFLKMFPIRFYAGEEGAPGGGSGIDTAVSDSPAPSSSNEVFEGSAIPKQFAELALQNDPELRAIKDAKDAERAARADKSKKKGAPPPEEHAEEKPPEDGKKVEGKDTAGAGSSETEPDFDALEFKDDVIPGIKGETLKKIGSDGVSALAEFHEKHTELSEKHAKTVSQLEELLKDPVIKARIDMKKAGKTEYTVRGVSDAERNAAIKLLEEKLSLDPQEAAEAFDIIRGGFEKIIRDSAEDVIQNRLLQEDRRTKTNETVRKARSIFLNMGKFNKNLSFKETDPGKFWIEETNEKGDTVHRLNEEHPEIENFKKYTLPVMNALAKAGFSYDQILKTSEEFGDDVLYSIAAKKLGLPVAINTEQRDQKIALDARSKALRPFLKGAASEELRTDGGSKVSGAKNKGDENQGIDLDKLIDDEKYYDDVMRRKPGDRAWMTYVSELNAKALRLRRQKQKR